MKKLKSVVIGLLLTISLILTGFLFSIPTASANVGGDSIPCYSVLKKGLINNYRAVECSSCTSKKCDNYTSAGKCTSTNGSGGISIN